MEYRIGIWQCKASAITEIGISQRGEGFRVRSSDSGFIIVDPRIGDWNAQVYRLRKPVAGGGLGEGSEPTAPFETKIGFVRQQPHSARWDINLHHPVNTKDLQSSFPKITTRCIFLDFSMLDCVLSKKFVFEFYRIHH
jgi:hypothetical protein